MAGQFLVKFEVARQALAEAKSVDELKSIRDQAEALRYAMKQAGMSLEMQNDAAELKLHAERRAGELLREMEKHPAGRPPENPSLDGRDLPPTIAELGLTYNQSQRWQLEASVPEEAYERFKAEIRRRRGGELTSAGLQRLAREMHQNTRRQEMIDDGIAQLAVADRYHLFWHDFRDWDLATGSVDAVITDPPYGQDYVPLYGQLAQFAARVLKPGGPLLVMTGQSWLPDVLAAMVPHIRYHWTLVYLTPGATLAVWHRRVMTGWKPVLWFVAGEYGGGQIWDVCRSESSDKRFDDWGQSESGMIELVRRFTSPGDLVCDPFLGAGTTGIASLLLGRRFIGCDVEAEKVHLAAGRLKYATQDASA